VGNGSREELANRTTRFAVAITRFYVSLPHSEVFRVLGRQLLKSGTSVGAHYREAYRAKSNADFISKIEGALQELDETDYWLDVLHEAGLVDGPMLTKLKTEANELISILVSIVRRVKSASRDAAA
jgi:four helix bundle protein